MASCKILSISVPGPIRSELVKDSSHTRRCSQERPAGLSKRAFISGGLLTLTAFVPTLGATASDNIADEKARMEKSEFVQSLVKRSQENKELYDKQRLDAYIVKNYKDYFEFTL